MKPKLEKCIEANNRHFVQPEEDSSSKEAGNQAGEALSASEETKKATLIN
jgi:hypothetical protein